MQPHSYEHDKIDSQQPEQITQLPPTESNMVSAPAPVFTTPNPDGHSNHPHLSMRKYLYGSAGIVVIMLALVGSYSAGRASKKVATLQPSIAKIADVKVPSGATVVSECIVGRGKQYILPKDIPGGPLYNVYNGKVVGLEFMMDATKIDMSSLTVKSDQAESSDASLWSLLGQKYEFIDAEIMPSGHAGFSAPHAMIDVMMISRDEAAKITCGSSSSTMSTDMKM